MTAGVLFTAGTVPMAPSAVVPVAAAADKDKADKDKSDKDKADKNKARPIASPAPKGPINNPVDAANAIVKDMSPLDELGRPKPEILNSMRALADQPGMDKKIADLIRSAVSYYEGEGEPGVNMPARLARFCRRVHWWVTKRHRHRLCGIRPGEASRARGAGKPHCLCVHRAGHWRFGGATTW